MAYLGNNLQVAYPSYRVIDDISSQFNGSLKTFALKVGGSTPIPFPINPQQCLISVNNIVQKPDSTGASGFTLTGSNIVFVNAPTSGWSFFGTVLAGADYVNLGANFPSGTAAVPSITFDESTGTGLFLASSNVLGIATSGVQQLTVDSSGNVSVTGALSTTGTNTAASFIPTSSTVPTNGVYLPAANSVAISTGGSGRLFISSAGLIGVNQSSPGSALDVAGEIRIYPTSGTGNLRFGSAGVEKGKVAVDASSNYTVETAGSERLRITAGGLVGVGTSSPSNTLHVVGTGRFNVSGANNAVISSDGGDPFFYTEQAAGLKLGTNSAVRMTINSSGNVGIGNSSPGAKLDISGSNNLVRLGDGTNTFDVRFQGPNNWDVQLDTSADKFNIQRNSTSLVTVDSAGRLGIGSTSPQSLLHLETDGTALRIVRGSAIGFAYHTGTAATDAFRIQSNGGSVDLYSAASQPITFSAGGTEKARIDSSGRLLVGTSTFTDTVNGFLVSAGGSTYATSTSTPCANFNRLTDDGELLVFKQGNTQEGSISVSGTTVSYNGAHLSRWSQLPSGAERTEILRGTLLSNIDEMCEWGNEDNEQLNRMKVSEVEGDKNVSGVFQAWDDDDDTYANDFYCAMTGDFIIRIAESVTVERGDLLMSAGDGTAKPQDDDIIRSKTIAKVNSTTVSCTYDDGSYCVPCVLMAC